MRMPWAVHARFIASINRQAVNDTPSTFLVLTRRKSWGSPIVVLMTTASQPRATAAVIAVGDSEGARTPGLQTEDCASRLVVPDRAESRVAGRGILARPPSALSSRRFRYRVTRIGRRGLIGAQGGTHEDRDSEGVAGRREARGGDTQDRLPAPRTRLRGRRPIGGRRSCQLSRCGLRRRR